MEVILTKDVDALGGKNEVVRVKDGYARNYLFPLKLAITASYGNLKSLKDKIRIANELKTKRIDAARDLAEKLSKLHLTIVKKAGKEGKIFGAVTAQEIVDKIKETGEIDLDKRRIHIPAHLKTLGTHTIPCRLEVGVTATLHLDVRSDEPVKAVSEPEAEGQSEEEPASDEVTPRKFRGASSEEAVADEPRVVQSEAKEDKPKKAKRKSEAEADLPEDADAPKKKKKKKGINEAEADLP